ncbi:MAG: hypothetical protein LBP27_07155, partial [Treponema sp.]|nr:hypothetical protein [Treponema sp.]
MIKVAFPKLKFCKVENLKNCKSLQAQSRGDFKITGFEISSMILKHNFGGTVAIDLPLASFTLTPPFQFLYLGKTCMAAIPPSFPGCIRDEQDHGVCYYMYIPASFRPRPGL